MTRDHGFKNQIGPAGSIGDRCLIQFDSLKKMEIWKKWSKTENRWFNRKNREPSQLNQFWPGSLISKTTPFWIFFFPNLNLNIQSLSLFPSSRCFSLSFSRTPSLSQFGSPAHDLSLSNSISQTHDLNLTVSLSGSRSITETHDVTNAITLTDSPSRTSSLTVALSLFLWKLVYGQSYQNICIYLIFWLW